jgi:hypothetical protein
VPERDLNAHIIEHLGSGTVNELQARAREEDANFMVLKASALAGQKSYETYAIVKVAKWRTKRWWQR